MSRDRVWWLLDLVVVLVLATTAVAQIWSWTPEPEGGPAVHTVLALTCTLPLLLRRRYAAAVFLTVALAAWVQLELGGELGQPFFAFVIALYAVGAHASRPSTYAGPVAVLLQVLLVDLPRLDDGEPWDEVVPTWFILAGIWGFGRWMRHRARQADELRRRTEAAERDKHALSQQAVADERARIARELHDLVAHSMGVIVIQAQGAQRALDASPERARQALESIEAAGRSGLAEMRRLLGLLSDDGSEVSTAPQPTLGGVTDLVEQLRGAGLPVDLEIKGEVRLLPAGLELTGYRLVQEAITNSLKHAGQVPVDVRMAYEPDWLDIQVTDEGPAGSAGASARKAESGSRGLAGMAERVSLYGGILRTGPRPDGGFAVHARLPLEGRPT
jgi:signal transduction histidine kinase